MSKKVWIIVVVLLLLAIGGYYYYTRSKSPGGYYAPYGSTNSYSPSPVPTPTPATTTPTSNTNVNGTAAPAYTPPQSQTGGENAGSNVQVTEVDFDGTKYTPNPANIKVGDYIFFKNKSSSPFWPAPGANAYPGFGSGQYIAPGGEYKIQFNKAGSFGYYEYSNPLITGTVNVSQ